MTFRGQRLHRPTITGRMRTDPGPLLLIGVVVALTTALTSAVTPLITRTSDRAIAQTVRHAGSRGDVVATFPTQHDDESGSSARDPHAAAVLRVATITAQRQLPKRAAAVLGPGRASLTTNAFHLLGAGPGRYLRLAYLAGPGGTPRVRYTAGGPPGATVRGGIAGTWPVQVAVSQPTAAALGLAVGDRLTADDGHGRTVATRVSGIFVATHPDDAAWPTVPELLHPAQGVSQGVLQTTGGALVSDESLPDLRLAVPTDDLIGRVAFSPRPTRVTWAESDGVARSVVALKASPGPALGEPSWDSDLDRVLRDGRAQVAAARGQADVLLLGLMACALLLLWQAGDLVVRRRVGSLVQTRERGGTLLAIAAELFVEAAVFAVAGAALGLLVTRLTIQDSGWAWWLPIPLAASLAAALTGAVLASRLTDPRRAPANRTARRVAATAHRSRRVLFLAAVVAAAVLSFVSLRQRGVAGRGGGDPTAASAATWWAVAGALLVIAALPVLATRLLDTTRRTSSGVAFFTAARVRETGTRALPLLVVILTVAQLAFAVTLTRTEQRGQAAGALQSVGGDVRARPASDHSATDLARAIAAAPGVRAAVAARVEDGVRATSSGSADTVRLVVVDAAAYERLLAVSALPDSPQLSLLGRRHDGRVPALLLGGSGGADLTVRESEDRVVPLSVVGTAPRVEGSVDPVLVVDAGAYAQAGGTTVPDTVWAVGPGAAKAARAAVGHGGSLVLYTDALAARRHAALAAGLVRLAATSSALLLLFAVLAVMMAAASEAGPRTESLGRLRALGLRERQLWGVLAGELTAPVLVGALTGLVLGLTAALAMFGQMSLERITGQVSPPDISLPPWILLTTVALLCTALVITLLEWRRLRRVVLGQLLRGGLPR